MKAAPFLHAPGGISLLGVPTDIGAGMLGARMGPEALRVAGLAQALERLGRSGVPVYVVYQQGRTPVVLSEILGVKELRLALANI